MTMELINILEKTVSSGKSVKIDKKNLQKGNFAKKFRLWPTYKNCVKTLNFCNIMSLCVI